ncbi:MAG: penicillin-insensitive murein endopeptidase [Myxococcaceae bacterium]|nr:penicillin-insensitive murein endopeptidase [Myxococcaceae bacterium]
MIARSSRPALRPDPMHRPTVATIFVLLFALSAAGCAHAPAPPSPAAPAASPPAQAEAATVTPPPAEPTQAAAPNQPAPEVSAPPDATTEDDDAVEEAAADDGEGAEEEPEELPTGPEGEGDAKAAPTDGEPQYRYTADLTDEMLQTLWKESAEKLGSISMGFVNEGRLINGVRFPEGDGWIVVAPERTWGTQETIDAILRVIRAVRAQYPDAPPLRVNQISAREGGYLRPHKSHQSGRDADLGFFYPTADPVRVREREKYIDVEKTWALLKAIITLTDVQFVLVDRRVQHVLYDYAVEHGEDRGWLDSIFRSSHPLVMHARGHRDHFHVRFYNPRAQELGRRVAPLLAQRPEQNLVMHRVRRGETLSHLAVRYNTTVSRIQKANRMRGTFLRVSQVLKIPLRGPCTRCPIPPPVEVPPRRLPPDFEIASHTPAPPEAVHAEPAAPPTVETPQAALADADAEPAPAMPSARPAESMTAAAPSAVAAAAAPEAAAPRLSGSGAEGHPAATSPAAR